LSSKLHANKLEAFFKAFVLTDLIFKKAILSLLAAFFKFKNLLFGNKLLKKKTNSELQNLAFKE
jgi:hypothetical protein